ncbi:MAG: peptidase MA family metallohydrolase [Vicinamibacteria bacterium]
MIPVAALLFAVALGGSQAQVASPHSGPEGSDLGKRLLALHRRSEAVRPGTPEARVLCRELGEVGRGYLDAGDPGRAIEILEEAYGWDNDNGLVLAELTLAYVRAEQYPFARLYLELAEERAPHAPPEIYAVLGEVYYSLNRVEDALLAWELFERLGGEDPRILRRLAHARNELSLAAGQKFLGADDFSLYFDAAVSRETVERIARRLSEVYREQSAGCEARLPADQVVILYAGRAYFSLVSIPDWVSGVFDGKIRVCLDPDGGVTPQLQAVLSHELAHALIRQASRDRAPGWLHEGLAQWWEGKRLLRNEFREAMGGRSPFTLDELEGNLARKADRATARASYAQALGLIEYLVQERGMGSLACLLRDLADGIALADALQKETGFSPEQLLSRWKAWAGL